MTWDPAEADDQQFEAELHEDTERDLRDGRPPYRVVRCTETDDYTAPRGELWPSGQPYDFGPGVFQVDVREGKTYVVNAGGMLIAELL